jgi:hypothetical protein
VFDCNKFVLKKSKSFKNLSSKNSHSKRYPQAVIKINVEIVFLFSMNRYANQTYYIVLFVYSINRHLKMFKF